MDIEKVKYVVECMLCENTTTVEAKFAVKPTFDALCCYAARNKNWATSYSIHGTFICCEACYPKAFDLSKGGQVGILRPEYEKLARKEK